MRGPDLVVEGGETLGWLDSRSGPVSSARSFVTEILLISTTLPYQLIHEDSYHKIKDSFQVPIPYLHAPKITCSYDHEETLIQRLHKQQQGAFGATPSFCPCNTESQAQDVVQRERQRSRRHRLCTTCLNLWTGGTATSTASTALPLSVAIVGIVSHCLLLRARRFLN